MGQLKPQPPHPQPLSQPPSFPPTPLVPPYKRGEDRGCFAFMAGGRTEDASLLWQGRGEQERCYIPDIGSYIFYH